MSKAELRYLGPVGGAPSAKRGGGRAWLRKVPIAFFVVVVAPTLVSAVYLLGVATPRYVSEARFVVRSASGNQQPSSLGVALQGVGLSAASTDNFAVQEYLTSANVLHDLQGKVDVRRMYDRPGVDFLSRVPGLFSGDSFESLRKGVARYVEVGYNSTTGISTLRVEAFTAKDAQKLNEALLDGGEDLVNRLNERSAADAVREAQRTLREAEERLAAAQSSLTNFRTRERFIDPEITARETANLIGELSVQLATLRAERSQLVGTAPNSPQLEVLERRISAFEGQIAAEQAKLAGRADSLAPKLSAYETLMLEREFADKLVAAATAALNSAQLEARRQQLYLDRIVAPNLPDMPEQPKRFMSLLAIFTSLLLAYGVGWLVWAGVRESRLEE